MASSAVLTRWSTGLFLAALVVLGALAVAALWEMERLENATRWTLHTRDVLSHTDRVLQLVTDAETATRGYVMAGDLKYLDPYRVAVRDLPKATKELAALVADSADQQQRVITLLPSIDARMTHLSRVIDTRRTSGMQAAQELVRAGYGYDLMDRVRTLLAQVAAVEESLLQRRLDDAERHAGSTRIALILLAVTAPVFLLLSWVLNRKALEQLRDAQLRARMGEARLFSTLQSCGDGLIVTDESGKVTMLNPVAQALTGWREDQARGAPLEEVFKIVNEFTREAVESPVARVLREGKVVGLANHTILIARDGTERPIDDSGAPIKGEKGETIGVVLVFRDVTHRKASEQARERLLRAESEREAAINANAAKDQFLALVSHELRAPLAGIRGWLHLLQSGSLPAAEAAGALQRIQRNARLQERLINDLLDVSRITAGKLEVIRSPVDLSDVVAAAVEECMPSAEQKNVALTVEKAAASVLVLGDEHRLVQSISNLIGNSIKFTPPGGRVTVRLERRGERAVVSVTDTGVGMSAEVLGHLFERFWQADTSKTREHGGLGLGLAITKYLVEEHEGTVRANSEGLDRGSTFTIELPLLPTTSDQQGRKSLSAAPSNQLDGIRVLLVDDDEDTRESLALLLRSHGAQADTAESFQSALGNYEARRPDVVITDIGAPEGERYRLRERICARDRDPQREVPIIALTDDAPSAAQREALARDFDAYLVKPVNPLELIARICSLVRGGK